MDSNDGTQQATGDMKSIFEQMSRNDDSEHTDVIQKLQAIRLWQLMQQEELKKQQQTQLALLRSQQNSRKALAQEQDSEDEILAIPISDLPSSPLAKVQHVTSGNAEKLACVDDSDKENQLRSEMGDKFAFKQSSDVDTEQDETCDQGEHISLSQELMVIDNFETVVETPDHDEDSDVDESDYQEVNVENSFEKSSQPTVSFDDLPVKGGKTFEEILADQLGQDKVANSSKQASASTPKRTFLKKGQGIARFNGPPKQPKIKKKPPKIDVAKSIPVTIKVAPKPTFREVSEKQANAPYQSGRGFDKNIQENTNIVKNDCLEEVELAHKPRIRKTSRLARREPMKQLTLVPEDPKASLTEKNWLLNSEQLGGIDEHNESTWSEVEDATLLLDTTDPKNDLDKTSNETFEQMEQFCNEHYADISTVKTLDDDDSVIMKKIEPLPPNKLMLSLFPSLRSDSKKKGKLDSQSDKSKPKETMQSKGTEGRKQLSTISEADAVEDDSIQSTILKKKLEEMKAEIEKFQSETAKLNSVRKQEESQLQLLKDEFEEFQRQKEDELKRLEEFKKSETKKLKKDRKLFDEHVAGIKSLPSKQDREYIHELESRISELQNEAKLKEQRLSAVNSRLRSQVEVSNSENEKLKEQIQTLEEKLKKFEREEKIRKSKKSQVAWKAINDIVDSIPANNENENIDDYIENHSSVIKGNNLVKQTKSLPLRDPLSNHSDNQLNVSEVTMHEGKVERRKKDGTLEISFQNGTHKYVLPDGTVQIKFTNGDVKTVLPDGVVKYHYIASGTWHTTHPNGMEVMEFSNKQVERHFPDGSKHITFEDGSSKMMKLDGTEETIFPDGTMMTLSSSGDKTIEFSNGQREIHTKEFKRREYPDGTRKTVFSDGRQETQYASGRLRIKDANGTLIVDKMIPT